MIGRCVLGLVRIVLVLVALAVTSTAWATGPIWAPGTGGGSGDITDVWSCATGDCSALTAATGDTLDASGADTTIPWKVGTTLPATCTVGESYFKSNARCGQQAYVCNATNTWTAVDQTRFYNVECYGAIHDDAGDDTTAIQAAVDAAGANGLGGVVFFPPGNWTLSSITVNPGAATKPVTIQGSGENISNSGTQLDCSGSSGTCITFSTNCRKCGLRDLSMSGGGGTLTFVDDQSAGSSRAERLTFIGQNYCVGLKNVDLIRDVTAFAPVAGTSCRAISSVDQVQVLIDHFLMATWTADIEGGIVIEQTGTNQPDSILISNSTIAQQGGAGAALKLMAADSTKAPRWVMVSNSQFEAKTTGAATATKDYAIDLEAVRDFQCSNCYAEGGYNAVRVSGGPGPITFTNSIIGNSQHDAFYHDADVTTSLIGTTVSDASQASTGVDSGVNLTANSKHFSMSGGTASGDLILPGGANQKYGILVNASADKYRFSNVTCEGNATACASGLSGAATQTALTDATAYGDTDWSNYVELKAPTTVSANWTLTLPGDNGTTGDVLCDAAGDGVTSWCAPTRVAATSCASGLITASDGTVSCLTATGTPEYIGRIETAGATVHAYYAVTRNGTTADSVIEADPATVTSIVGCSQSATDVTSTNTLMVAMRGVALCKADSGVTAGSLVKLGATGVMYTATDQERTYGRAITDYSAGTGTAQINLFSLGSEGYFDHMERLWDSFPDVTAGQTVNAFVWAPTFSQQGASFSLSRADGLYLAPTVNWDASSGTNHLTSTRLIEGAGTFTDSGAGGTYFNHGVLFIYADPVIQSTAVGKAPVDELDTFYANATVKYTAASGTGTSAAVRDFYAHSTLDTTGAGAHTVTAYNAFEAAPGIAETAGTTTVTTARGFYWNPGFANSPTVTTAVGVDIAAANAAETTHIGIRNADTTVYTPTTQAIAAATDTFVCDTTFKKFTTATGTTTMTSNPTIADGVTGQICILENVDATATDCVTFPDGTTGLQLSAAITLCPNDTLTLIYDGTDWIQLATSNN